MSHLRYTLRIDERGHHLARIELRFPVDPATIELAGLPDAGAAAAPLPGLARRTAPRRAGARHDHHDGALGMTLLQLKAMRCAILAAYIGVLAAMGCSKKTQDGLPPAAEWQTAPSAGSSIEAVPALPPPPNMGGIARDPSNPHAGLDMDNPHAGLDMDGDPSNPHAGLDMGGDPSNPHAGLDMGGDPSNPHAGGGTDVTKLGLAAPDPDRSIDPSHRVAGTISVDAKAKGRVKPGTAVFLTVKRAGPDGTPSGPPLAVDKLTWSGDAIPFELTEAQAMVAGTDLSGDVIVMARYDQDSDALSRQPGDITGQVHVKIPADHVKLTLDTVLP